MKKEILLAHFPKLTHKRYQQILAAFSDLDTFWEEAEFGELKKLNWNENFIHEFLLWKDELDLGKINKILDQEKITCITLEDNNYPALLREIYDPPFCIFIRGNINKINYPLAVVGPRKYSQYGKQVTQDITGELARHGVTIISGLAIGIDTIAHTSTLQSEGRTIAVLGSGVNKQHIYPATNRNLAEHIIEKGGAVISEYPPGALCNKYTFPRRNRIVAGMSLGALVIEAKENSGALITSQCALDNNREVFTIPQNITSPTSIGSNNLLKMGARPVTSAQDILDALNLQDIKHYVENKKIIPDSPIEEKILEHLSREPIHVDIITKKTQLQSHEVNSALTLMEMKGQLRNLGGMMYVIK